MRRDPTPAAAYAVAALAVALTLLARWPLEPGLGYRLPYITLLPAVLVAAGYGGLRAALLATALAAAAASFFLIEPRYEFRLPTQREAVRLGVFVLVGAAIGGTAEWLRRMNRRVAGEAARARATEDRLRAIIDNWPSALFVKDRDGRYLLANKGCEPYAGEPAEKVVGKTDYDYLPREVADRFRADDRRVLETGRVLRYEETAPLRGEEGHSLTVKFPLPDEAGRPHAVCGITTDITDLKWAEQALRERDEQLRLAVGATDLGTWDFNPLTGALDWSDRCKALFGLPPDVLVTYQTFLDGLHPGDRDRVDAIVKQALDPAGTGEYRTTYRTVGPANGAERWVEAQGRTLFDGGGRAVRFIGTIRDVTAERRAADAERFRAEAGEVLASSLDHEQTLAAVARLVVPRLADWCTVHVTDPDGRLRQLAVEHTDPAKVAWAKELAGRYPPAPDAPRGVPAVIRTGQPELVPEITDDMLVQAARDTEHLAMIRGLGPRSAMTVPLAARGRTLGAIMFVAAEGGRRYGPADLELALDLGRRAGLAVDNARLFGESREAQRLLGTLVETAGRLTRTLDPPAVRASVLDLSHRLIAADAYAIWRVSADGTEWAVADAAGLSDHYLRTAGRVEQSAAVVPSAPLIGEDVQADTPFETRRAAYRAEGIASLLAVPLYVHGRVSGTLTFYYHTRRKFDDLTVRVASALADLAGAAIGTAELYQRESTSRRRAEDADRAKDEFLALLGHELRNPLAPIRMAVGLLGVKPDDRAVVDRVTGIVGRQVTQMTRLVDELLDASRIARGKVRLTVEPLDLAALARTAAEDHRADIKAAGLTLAVEVPCDPVPVRGDAARLTQVIGNFLTNAKKFTDPGGRVTLRVGRDNGDAVVAITDTGVGLGPAAVPTLFQPFRQVEADLARSKGGLGLGLALVKGLVELHGGRAEADSPGPGQGSTFTLRLPIDPAGGAAAPAVEPVAAASPTATGRRVVVIEDREDTADSLRLWLEMNGYVVAVALNGPDGLALARQARPDVVVCDLGLPGMSGFDVAAALRADPATARALLVCVSGYGQEEDRRKARAAGFDVLLAKPADPTELIRVIAWGRAG
jgi:PAS domain S-box-containing protein